MFEFVTLRELCENVGVTRRAIQGYEKMGLVKANETNKYGHLLYGEVELERIKLIKLYQELGFSLKAVKRTIDASKEVKIAALENQVKLLKQKQQNVSNLIVIAEEMIKELHNSNNEI